MKIDENNLHLEPPGHPEIMGYMVKHYHPAGDRPLCMVKEVFRPHKDKSLERTEAEAREYMKEFLDPSYSEKDAAGVYVVELHEWLGYDDEGFSLLGEMIEKIKYKIEHTVKVTEL